MTPSQKLEALKANLLSAFCRKADAKAQLDAADKEIVAIRNVLAGVELKQQEQSVGQVP